MPPNPPDALVKPRPLERHEAKPFHSALAIAVPAKRKLPTMCDYSLHAIQSRPAEAGDVLITSKFPGTSTRGFSAAGEPETAVCLLPGTELAFNEDAVCHHPLARLFPRMHFGSVGGRLARFRKVNPEARDIHHDALEFANGKIVLLTQLTVGQKAKVLQLPARESADPKQFDRQVRRRSTAHHHDRQAARETP